MTAKTLSVPGISCEHCKTTIEQTVGELSGVGAVQVDISARTVEVDFEEAAVDLEQIIETIEEAGYEVPR
jgi:copper chaperone